MPERIPRRAVALAFGALLGAVPAANAQGGVPRILEQDSARDNLVQPSGYATAAPGTLGAVHVQGHGANAMVLIPGLGFGGEVFDALTRAWEDDFTMYTVTLAGFGGTAAPPVPPAGTSFGAQSWTDGAFRALEALIAHDHLERVVVVGHWLVGTQLALRLALAHPDRVRALILLAGSARWVPAGGVPPGGIPLVIRVRQVDENLAPHWFRTVTRETWDDNNFLPGDYAANPVLGLRLWRQAARPPLHVWVRYLCEFLAQDITATLDALTTPTLLVQPGLEGAYAEPNDYLTAYVKRSWDNVAPGHPAITSAPLPNTRVVPWADRPLAVDSLVRGFLAGLERR